MSIENAAAMAAEWWANLLQSGDRAKFTDTLYQLVLAALDEHGYCYLDCDYDPRGHLLTAVRTAGLECSGMGGSAAGILPMKHSLEVFPDHLEPKLGYGRWVEHIRVPS